MEESAMFGNNERSVFIRQRRKRNWNNPAEMEAFLNLLEENCEELSHLKRNFNVYYQMSFKMANQGFHREPVELRKKVSNVFSKYKQEKTMSHTDWPYFQRVHHILAKMKKNNNNTSQLGTDKQLKTEENNPEKSKNEKQKILVIASSSSNVCINENDMEAILKAMNGEDITSRSDDSSSAIQIEDASNELPDSEHSEVEEDDSRSSDMVIETTNQSPQKTTAPEITTENSKVNDQCTIPTLAIKRADDQDRSKIEKCFSVSKEPVKKTQECETCNSKKDEVDLYAALVGTRLRSLDEKSRHIAMNKIDNLLFKMKMEQFEGQQRSHNHSTPQKAFITLMPNVQKNDSKPLS